MSHRHGKACVARWLRHAAAEEWPVSRLVTEIAGCCSVSRLRAYRLARGWTLASTCEELRALCAAEGLTCPRIDADQLRVWETRSRRRPQRSTIDLLCRLYRTNAAELGLETANDYGVRAVPPAQPDSSSDQRAAAVPSDGAGVATASAPGEWLDSFRRLVDRTLVTGSVTAGQLDLLDERILFHRQRYLVSPPQRVIVDLVAELRDVQALAAERQPASVQVRLSEITAILATLIADALMKLGLLREADAWYATARTAADDSGQNELRARVRVQAAMLPYYYGPLRRAVRLAHEARLLMQNLGRPTNTSAFAAAAEARARARCGDAEGAENAMRLAQQFFAQAQPVPQSDAWAFPERRLMLYLSGTLTYLRQHHRARQAQRQAYALYESHPGGIDPALLRLEEALCLIHERHLSDACQVAGQAYLAVPPEHRTEILGARVRNVAEAVPERMRSARPARELNEILALPVTRR